MIGGIKVFISSTLALEVGPTGSGESPVYSCQVCRIHSRVVVELLEFGDLGYLFRSRWLEA